MLSRVPHIVLVSLQIYARYSRLSIPRISVSNAHLICIATGAQTQTSENGEMSLRF